MKRISVFVDIAGRPSRENSGGRYLTAGAVILETAALDSIRSNFPPDFPKWRDMSLATAREAARLLESSFQCAAGITIDKQTPEWNRALQDEKILQRAIVKQRLPPAGWAKLPVILVYEIIGRAAVSAIAHFLTKNVGASVLHPFGMVPIEFTVTVDEEISGEENIQTFKSFWSPEKLPNSALQSLGFQLLPPTVTITTDEFEPLLKLADFMAGLLHCAAIRSPGRIKMPIDRSEAIALIRAPALHGRISIGRYRFESSYDEIFGQAMHFARQERAA